MSRNLDLVCLAAFSQHVMSSSLSSLCICAWQGLCSHDRSRSPTASCSSKLGFTWGLSFFAFAGREDELHQQIAAQQRWLQEAAVKLSLQRQTAGKKLKSAVESSLAQLAMEGCEFEVDIAWSQSQEVENNSDAPSQPPPPRPFSSLFCAASL